MKQKILCLMLAALMTLSLWGCLPSPGDEAAEEAETEAETEIYAETADLSALGGWWAMTDEWMDRDGFRPSFGSFLLNPDTAEAECYDEYGDLLGAAQCILEGSTLTMRCDSLYECLEVEGDALLYDGVAFYRRSGEAPETKEHPVTDKDLSGKWYFGSDPTQWLEFYDDGTYSILNADGEILETDTYEISYLSPGYQDDIDSIFLWGSSYQLRSDTEAHAFYMDKYYEGFDCIIHEDSMDRAQRVLQVVRASNRNYSTDARDPDYPVNLRFGPFVVLTEFSETVGGEEQLYQKEGYTWDVTEDGILTLELYDGTTRTFRLDDIEDTIQLDPDGPVYYRDPDFPSAD